MARDSEIVTARRQRLREWIEERFGGSQAAFRADAKRRGHEINQGELSGLLRSKSFSENRAAKLEVQAAMPKNYLTSPIQSESRTSTSMISRKQNAEDVAPEIRLGMESLVLAVARGSQDAATAFLEDLTKGASARRLSIESGFLAGLVDIVRGAQSEAAAAGRVQRRASSAGRTKRGK